MSRYLALWLILLALLAGCGGPVYKDGAPEGFPDYSHVEDAQPRDEPISRAKLKPYTVRGRTYQPMSSAQGYQERGIASWYGTKFHGKKTANGERYDMYQMTAAHKLLPLPSYVEVTNLANNRRVVVRVNDRGPFHDQRIIDLSYAAASKLGILSQGTAMVEVRAIDARNPGANANAAPTPPRHTPRIYIQVGAFAERDNALRLRNQLANELSHPIQIENSDHVHRVQVGPLTSTDTADRIIAQLQQLRIYDSRMLLR